MKTLMILACALSTICLTSTLARSAEPEGPCKTIKDACSAAGFVQGQAKQGTGLWVDCIDPIMRGTPQPKKAVKPLPQVDPGVVAACKAKRPGFGEPKSGQHT